VIGTIEIQ